MHILKCNIISWQEMLSIWTMADLKRKDNCQKENRTPQKRLHSFHCISYDSINYSIQYYLCKNLHVKGKYIVNIKCNICLYFIAYSVVSFAVINSLPVQIHPIRRTIHCRCDFTLFWLNCTLLSVQNFYSNNYVRKSSCA